ncbi:MAG: hypothetical protein ABR975_01185, partial [Vulcanimicrobiaceae bacterium]|jgi:hypothetical protein
MRRWLTVAGLAAAVVPSAALVHIVAEASALGSGALTPAFVLRHVYLGLLVLASLAAFARTVGIGRPRAELRRRVALLRTLVRAPHRWSAVAVLVAAHLGFFALTQLGEGVPLLGGDVVLGLSLGVIGSLLAALTVAFLGRTVVDVAIRTLSWRQPQAAPARRAHRRIPPSRAAARVFSLFVPNRPPPFPSLT